MGEKISRHLRAEAFRNSKGQCSVCGTKLTLPDRGTDLNGTKLILSSETGELCLVDFVGRKIRGLCQSCYNSKYFYSGKVYIESILKKIDKSKMSFINHNKIKDEIKNGFVTEKDIDILINEVKSIYHFNMFYLTSLKNETKKESDKN